MQEARPPRRRLNSIRSRMLLVTLGLVIVPTLLITVISVYGGLRSAQGQVTAQMDSVIALKKAEIDTWLQGLVLDLNLELAGETTSVSERVKIFEEMPASSPEYQAAYSAQLERFRNTIMLRRNFEELFIMDSKGEVVLSSTPSQVAKVYAEREYFKNGLKAVSITAPFFEISFGKYSIIVSQPIRDSSGNVVGVLAGRASLDTLSKIMTERAGLGDTGETYLLGSNYVLLTGGRFVNKAAGENFYVRTDGATNAVNLKTGGSAIYRGYTDNYVVGVYSWLPDLDVALIAEQNLSEAFGGVLRLLLISAGLGQLAVVIAVLVALAFTRSIANPITNLAEAARQIAAGDLSQELKLNRGDEIGDLAQAFDSMTLQLRGLIGTLEQRIADRTRALEASSEVSRRLSTILNSQELVSEVVTEVQHAFNYYHVHIYLFDEQQNELVMVGGTGEAGAVMLASGHKISRGRGLVGQAAETRQPVLVPDTSQNPGWLPNPLLPETRAEIAVPIIAGDQVLGVLDVQHNVFNGLSEADGSLLLSVANQVGVALQNARLYDLTQRRANREGQANLIYQRLQTATTVDDLLQMAVRELGSALSVEQAQIELGLKQNGR